MSEKKIFEFLDDFCVIVQENEESYYVELMMDDHDCVYFDGCEYYVPKNHSLYTIEDVESKNYLIENHLI